MANGFIKNYDLIQEDCRVDDLLDFSESIDDFTQLMETVQTPAIIGLIGKFGCGKSTMLYQIQKQKQDSVHWINFDAWKYPERRDLWEGFVLDFADQVGDKNKALKRIDGKEKSIGKTIAKAIGGTVSGLGGIAAIAELFESSPATRVFQIQEILLKIINGLDKPMHIVVEDIDRSHDRGIYFIETLKQFLRDNNLKQDVIVVVPISDESYDSNKSSYLKCLDYIEFFNPKISGLDKFVEAIISESCLADEFRKAGDIIELYGKTKKEQIASFCVEILKQPDVTIRHLKTILRSADVAYMAQSADGHSPDWRVTICFEAATYLRVHPDQKQTYIELFRQKRYIGANTLFAAFLYVIQNDSPYLILPEDHAQAGSLAKPAADFKCIKRTGNNGQTEYPSKPWQYGGSHSQDPIRYGVCDFYLDY